MGKYYLIAIGAISLVTFVLYAVDKLKARAGAFRVPEAVLLGFSFFGGAAGGFLAMLVCRHKTKRWYFYAVNLLALFIHVAVGVFLFR